MAELQAMGKPNWTNNCPQLADNFTSGILDKHGYIDEIRIVFERYDIQRSLKQTTRNITQGTHILAVVHITDKTNIAKVPMKTTDAVICQHKEGD